MSARGQPANLESVVARSACSIRRLDARYRMPASRVGERTRLDRALTTALDELVEAAIERAGVSAIEEICVRALHVMARVRLDVPDAELSLAWSLAVADAISRELRDGGPNVVRYGSRHHALVDFVSSAARTDCARAWAWRQLGLWHGGEDSSTGLLIDGALAALAENAHAAPSVLAEVSRRGGLRALTISGSAERWETLAAAAVHAAGGDWRVLVESIAAVESSDDADDSGRTRITRDRRDRHGTRYATDRRDVHEVDDATMSIALTRVMRRSAIAHAMDAVDSVDSAATLPAAKLLALAVLAILETSPEAPTATRQLAVMVVRVQTAILQELFRKSNESAARVRGTTAGARERARNVGKRVTQERSRVRCADAVHVSPEHGGGPAPGQPADAPYSRDAVTPASDDEPVALDIRTPATTNAGGVLFLLHLLRDSDLPSRIAAEPALATRSLAWTLHRVAIALADVEPQDPAALAFCGRRPIDASPAVDEPPPTDDELFIIDSYCRLLAALLHERLGGIDSVELVLASVIRRRAEIVGDPGWIDVRYSLDEVSVPVRRAGLDLDPGWLPWLGVVLRFVYG